MMRVFPLMISCHENGPMVIASVEAVLLSCLSRLEGFRNWLMCQDNSRKPIMPGEGFSSGKRTPVEQVELSNENNGSQFCFYSALARNIMAR